MLKDLVVFEEEHKVWELTFLQYPIWMYCREDMSKRGIAIKQIFHRPSLKNIWVSMYKTLRFFWEQKKYKKVYFLANRKELLEVHSQDTEKDKILFLFNEGKKENVSNEHIDATFFNIVRYLLRKVTYIFAPLRYKNFVKSLESLGYDESRFIKTKRAMGDAVFLKILAYILNDSSIYLYAGAVVPQGEKFLNLLNSFEVQHGVIHPEHVGYIGIPEVKNRLILYDAKYIKILEENEYKGKLVVNRFKEIFLTEKTNRNFFSVIYTQPIEKMQTSIESFFKTVNPTYLRIQKHPRDAYMYDLDEVYFVKDTRPSEVQFPVCYASTIIENFISVGKDCFIYDVKDAQIDLDSILSVYMEGFDVKLMRYNTLNEIYKELLILKDRQ